VIQYYNIMPKIYCDDCNKYIDELIMSKHITNKSHLKLIGRSAQLKLIYEEIYRPTWMGWTDPNTQIKPPKP